MAYEGIQNGDVRNKVRDGSLRITDFQKVRADRTG